MSLRVVFLGTSGSVPTLKRGLPALALMTKKEMLLFDCGEGAQRQMMGGKVSFHKKMRIFITHLHGDHVLGLPGLLQTMALMERKEPVDVYGPAGLAAFMQSNKDTLNFCLNYPVTIHEIEGEGVVCDAEDYQILAVKSSHAIECYCLAFQEKPHPGRFNPKKAAALGVPKGELWSKLQNGYNVTSKDGATVEPNMVLGPLRRGRKIVYTGDTKPFTAFAEFAKDADLVVHDCTFDESLLERAERDGHSTPRQAAEQAKAAGAKKLALTHISARYPDASALLETAKKVFPDTILAEDYLELEIELPE